MLQLATRVPVIVLLQAEDTYPALKTSCVSVLVMFSAKYVCSFYHIPVVTAVMEALYAKSAPTGHLESVRLLPFIVL
jgi:hypothetical protein